MAQDADFVLSVVGSGKREEDIAAEIKAEVVEAMKPVLALMAKAGSHRMLVAWDNVGPDAFGRYQVNGLKLVRHY